MSKLTPAQEIAELKAKLEAAEANKPKPTGFQNCTVEINGDILTVTVDMSKEIGLSKSLKSINIGTTGGNQKIPGSNATIGLNVYRKNPDFVKPAKAA